MSRPIDPRAQAFLEKGIEAAKAGNQTGARSLIKQAVAANPRSVDALMWLASLASSPEETRPYLLRILAIEPENQRADRWLARLRETPSATDGAWTCFLCGRHAPVRPLRCPRCGAHLSFTSLRDFESDAVDRELIASALEPLRSQTPASSASRAIRLVHQRRLALAYLNLGDHERALDALQRAITLQPADGEIRQLAETLECELQWNAMDAATAPAGGAASARQASEPGPAPASVAASAQAPSCVLVVDDSPTVRRMVSVTLARQGFEVLEAADGMEALAKLYSAKPDIVLLDVSMPNLDGLKVCQVIKSADKTRDIPVIFLSGKDRFLDKVRGRVAGAVDYLTKPFQPQSLLRAIEKHLPES